MRYSLVISNTPVDLFNDESINLTRQLKDLQELSTVYTDFTQSINIPATPNNNTIFSNWFSENALLTGWNPNNGLDANILIHGLPVFEGRIELKGAKFLDGLPSSYDLIFYGKSKSILDLWGESLLNEIDFSSLDHTANYSNVTSSWAQTLLSGDIVYPLADYETGFRYSNFTGVNDNIKKPRGIEIDDLRPAIRLKKLISNAFASVGYSVTGSFFSRADLTNLYVLPMQSSGPLYNKATSQIATFEARNASFSLLGAGVGTAGFKKVPFPTVISNPASAYNVSTSNFTANRSGYYDINFAIQSATIFPVPNTLRIAVCKNGVPFQSKSFTSSFTTAEFLDSIIYLNTGDVVTIEYLSYSSLNTMSGLIFKCIKAPYGLKDTGVEMADAMPQIKIKDFINSVFKTFNLVAIPNQSNEVELHNIYDWYELGNLKDYTPYLDIKEISHEKIPVPATISFAHKESETLANGYFKSVANREYGSMSYSPIVDFPKDELKIESIFNVLAPTYLDEVGSTGQKIRVSQLNMPIFLDKEGKGVKQDLTLFYYAGLKSVTDTYYFENVLQNTFPCFSTYSNAPTSKTNYSAAFGLENSFSGDAPLETFYMMYWHKYVSRMYSEQSRVVRVKAILPVLEWLNMKLNDTIVLSGNYYKMQSIQYDMLTEVANLELITYPDINFMTLDSTGDEVDYGDPVENNNGLTYIRNYPVASGLMNSINSGGVNIINTSQDVSYAENSTFDLLKQMATVQNTLTFNQYTLWSNTPTPISTNDTVWIPIPQVNYEQIGYVGNINYNLANAKFTSVEGGQFKFIGMVSYQSTGNKHLEFAIFINGLQSTAYATSDSNFHSVQIDTILTLGEGDEVQFMFKHYSGGGTHSISVLKTNFIILKK
jgi:hypothetical protein